MKRTMLFLLLFQSLSVSLVFGLYEEHDKETLKGLNSFFIGINLNQEAKDLGLADQIKTDINSKLLMTGIKILSYDEWLTAPGKPLLVVEFNVMKVKNKIGDYTGEITYAVGIEVQQEVVLSRDANISAVTTTWASSCFGYTHDPGELRNALNYRLDDFCNAYLSVNPKE